MIDLSKFLPEEHPEFADALLPLFRLLEKPEYSDMAVVATWKEAKMYRTDAVHSAMNRDFYRRLCESDSALVDSAALIMAQIAGVRLSDIEPNLPSGLAVLSAE